MRFILLCLLLTLSFISAKHRKHPRKHIRPIVGGVDADIGRYPYQVSVGNLLKDDEDDGEDDGDKENENTTDEPKSEVESLKINHFCGGSIISVDWVLSAGHCLDDVEANEIGVRVGATELNKGGHVHEVEKIIVHPKYEQEIEMDCDIALVKVKIPFEFGPNVKPIPLNKYPLRPGMIAIVTGWGTTSSGGDSAEILQKVEVSIVPHWECEWLYGPEKLSENMFCAGRAGRDSCQGDSGGPVMVDGHQIGVVSWGEGCGFAGYPGIYATVHRFRDWIRKHSGV